MPIETGQNTRKRVWILGAGFSRSLGGPLMRDLLSLAARRRMLAAYSPHLDRNEVDAIFWLFHYGSGFPEGRLDPRITEQGEHAWDDAEQFLETLDNARSDAAKLTVLNSVLSGLRIIAKGPGQVLSETAYPCLDAFRGNPAPTAHQLAAMARRIVAASCCMFLEGVDSTNARLKERWLPYQQWLGCLGRHDSILTFNYDLVVELLQPIVGEVTAAGTETTRVRVHGMEPAEQIADHQRGRPSLYKLHGSVNWVIDHDNGKPSPKEWTRDLLARQYSLAIATPGDSKMEMADGIFKRLWEDAASALREADDVFIIGFRFPSSDAFPRDKLLGALRDNQKPSLKVNLVLGPDQNSDLRRVLALLQWSTGLPTSFDVGGGIPTRMLIARSLWAEDYLSVWAREELRARV